MYTVKTSWLWLCTQHYDFWSVIIKRKVAHSLFYHFWRAGLQVLQTTTSHLFIAAPCILKNHLISHTNGCTSISYIKISLKPFTLKHSYCSDMFRQHISCHPQGALMVLAKITIKHRRSNSVRGVAARNTHWIHSTQQSKIRVCCHTPYTNGTSMFYSDFS